jgi:hypothetical protein
VLTFFKIRHAHGHVIILVQVKDLLLRRTFDSFVWFDNLTCTEDVLHPVNGMAEIWVEFDVIAMLY